MALANLAQHVRRRHAHVVEVDRARGRALDPHLLLFGSKGDAWRGERHDEGRVFGLVDLGEGHHHVGEAGVGDPLLLSVEDVALAVARGACLDAHGIGAGARLGQGVGAHDRAGRHTGQPARLLLGRAIVHDRQCADGGVHAPGHAEGGLALSRYTASLGLLVVIVALILIFPQKPASKAH